MDEGSEDGRARRTLPLDRDQDDGANGEAESSVEQLVESIPTLIAEQTTDQLQACLQFIHNYTARYGEAAPVFFPGTLQSAVTEAFSNSPATRRLLALYCHHGASIRANIFSSQLLAHQSIRQLLSAHFVVWGWDISNKTLQDMFMSTCEASLGRSSGSVLIDVKRDRLPAIVIFSRIRSCTEIRRVVYGDVSLEEFLTTLTDSVNEFNNLKEAEVIQEKARASRERLKSAQDLAYKESLEIDRAKAAGKRRKLDHSPLQGTSSTEKVEKDKLRKSEEEKRLENLSNLPDEPGAEGSVVTMRFRPGGEEYFHRRFQLSSRLLEVLQFLAMWGYTREEYKFLLSWPRKDLSDLPPSLLLSELSLNKQETVIIQLR